MRISCLDTKNLKERYSLSELLRRQVAATTDLEAECWKKLEELAKHLESNGAERELWGSIMFKTVWLSETEPSDPAREAEFKKFRDEWQAANPDYKGRGKDFAQACRKRFPLKPKTNVTICMDWPDYTTRENVMSQMYYRFKIERPGKKISEDARAQSIVEADRIVRRAFRC